MIVNNDERGLQGMEGIIITTLICATLVVICIVNKK